MSTPDEIKAIHAKLFGKEKPKVVNAEKPKEIFVKVPEPTIVNHYTIEGIKGDTGLQGPKGDRGEIGPQGLIGKVGECGLTGPEGKQGPKGDSGPQGIAGVPGPAGSVTYSELTDEAIDEKIKKGFWSLGGTERYRVLNATTNKSTPYSVISKSRLRVLSLKQLIAGSNISIADDGYTLTLSATGGAGGGTWGSITGTLSSQTDLQTALNAKQNSITTGTTAQYFRGDLSLATFPTNVSTFTNDSGYLTSNQNITLSGDATGSGTTAITVTLATVNSNVGSFGNFTVNGKGLITAASTALANGTTGTTQAAADNSTKIATTAYADTAAANAALTANAGNEVDYATIAKLPNSPIYNNGVSGVGATITTLTTNTGLVVDGNTLSLGDEVLVKNEGDAGGLGAAKNGLYYLSTVPALGVAWVLTRNLDYDMPSDINYTGAIYVKSGSTLSGNSYALITKITTVGTDVLTYTLAIPAYSAIQLITNATQAYMLWNSVSGTSQAASVNNGYITSNAGLTTITLPSSAAVGDRIAIVGAGTGGWSLAQNASQKINFGNAVSTTGVGGSIASQNTFDSLEIICITTNTTFVVRSAQGNMTVT